MLGGLSDWLIAIVVVLVLSASMSTLSSLVLASSSTLTLDFLKDNMIKDMDEKKQVKWMRSLIVVFIAVSVVLAIIQYRSNVTFIAQLMGVSWGALAGAFLAPFLLGLYWKGVTPAAVWASFIWGVGLIVVNMLSGNAIANPINCGAIAMVGGFPVVWIVSLLTKKMPADEVNKIFECYKK
jgi:Na+(H+)/acetate symporter ActP